MTIEKIDPELCTRCGLCSEICPMDVIRMDNTTGSPIIRYPEDCSNCGKCEQNCPMEAIYVSPRGVGHPLMSW